MISIKIENKNFENDIILQDISLEIKPHETVALLGPSGIGKTTFLRIVAGLDDNFNGTRMVTEKIAYVFQEPTLLDWRTAKENITLIANVSADVAQASLAELGLESKADHYPQQLSLGQRRRLGLARAFAIEPEFLIMDEPFASLDEALAQEMLELTKNLIETKKMTTLFVTHSKSEASFLADRVLTMQGRPATIAES